MSKEPQTDYAIQLFISGKMSCIDAAIIKALVEHIGGNPDDVVVGGGSSMIQATWDTELMPGTSDYAYTFTLPAGETLKLGTCLKFYSFYDKEFHYYYCTSIDMEADGGPDYMFQRLDDTDIILSVRELNNKYYCWNIERSNYNIVPDNKTTGVSNLTGDALSYAAAQLIIKVLNI